MTDREAIMEVRDPKKKYPRNPFPPLSTEISNTIPANMVNNKIPHPKMTSLLGLSRNSMKVIHKWLYTCAKRSKT